jgi:hypothetical protein
MLTKSAAITFGAFDRGRYQGTLKKLDFVKKELSDSR